MEKDVDIAISKKVKDKGKVNPKYLFNYCERWEEFETNCYMPRPGLSILNYYSLGSYCKILFSISLIY